MRLIEKSFTESLYTSLKESNNNWEVVKECTDGEIVEKGGNQYYNSGQTFNGHCFKDAEAYEKDRNAVCYINEGVMDELSDDDGLVSVEEVNNNLSKYIERGGVSTHQSICDEVRAMLEHEEYFYEYDDGRRIEAKDIDDGFVEQVAKDVFENVDWQTTQALLLETDWVEDLEEYYNNKPISESVELKEATDEEAEKMLSIQRWMENNDFEDRWEEGAGWSEPTFDYMKKQNYNSFVSEKRSWVAYKDRDALPEFDAMVKSLNESVEDDIWKNIQDVKYEPDAEKKTYSVDDFNTLEDAVKEVKRVKGIDYFTRDEWESIDPDDVNACDDYIKDIVDNVLNESVEEKAKGLTLDVLEDMVFKTEAQVVVEDICEKAKSDELIDLILSKNFNNSDEIIDFIVGSEEVEKLREEDLKESSAIDDKVKEKLDEILKDIENDSLIKKYMLDHTWTSGSSTTVYPIIVSIPGKDITVQLNTDKNVFNKLLKRYEEKYPELAYATFWKSDGSCPSTLNFKLDYNYGEELKESEKEHNVKYYVCLECNKDFEIEDDKWPYGEGDCPYCLCGDIVLEDEEELTESVKNNKDIFYFVVGICLDENRPNADKDDFYDIPDFKIPFKLMDENYGVTKTAEEAVGYVENYVSGGVPGTFGVVIKSEEPFEGFKDDIDGGFNDSIDFYDITHFKENNGELIYCAYSTKDHVKTVEDTVYQYVDVKYSIPVKVVSDINRLYDFVSNKYNRELFNSDGIDEEVVAIIKDMQSKIMKYDSKEELIKDVDSAIKFVNDNKEYFYDGINEEIIDDLEKIKKDSDRDIKEALDNNALRYSNIPLRGSGIKKHIEAVYTPGCLQVFNEEWGFCVYNGEVDTNSMENMSQYWFYDDYMNNEEFRNRIDKAAKALYNKMSKEYKEQSDLTESLSVENKIKKYLDCDDLEEYDFSDHDAYDLLLKVVKKYPDKSEEAKQFISEVEETEKEYPDENPFEVLDYGTYDILDIAYGVISGKSGDLTESAKSKKKKEDKRVIMQQGNVTCFKESDSKFLVFENENDNEKEYKDQESAMKDFMDRVGVDIDSELKEK